MSMKTLRQISCLYSALKHINEVTKNKKKRKKAQQQGPLCEGFHVLHSLMMDCLREEEESEMRVFCVVVQSKHSSQSKHSKTYYPHLKQGFRIHNCNHI